MHLKAWVNMFGVGAEFPERANCRTWARAAQCNVMKMGTRYAGMSTRGNCAIGPVVTVPLIPGTKPEQIVPREMATTRSTMPMIFQSTRRRLVAKDGWRISPSTLNALRAIDEVVPHTNITSATATAH